MANHFLIESFFIIFSEQAVKLESARAGRTRYLVVVSCSRKQAQRKSLQQQNNLINAQNININNNKSISNSNNNSLIRSGSIENQNINSNITPSPNRKANTSVSPEQISNSSVALSATLKSGTKNLINEKDITNLSRLSTSPKQDEKLQQPLQQMDNFDEMTQSGMNEIEESCLLGIDCNEKTSVGLVLRILGDTTIRLDGDG